MTHARSCAPGYPPQLHEVVAIELDVVRAMGLRDGLLRAARHLRAYAAAGHGRDGGALAAAAARLEGEIPRDP
jgi:hypothetical protein